MTEGRLRIFLHIHRIKGMRAEGDEGEGGKKSTFIFMHDEAASAQIAVTRHDFPSSCQPHDSSIRTRF